MAGLLKSIFVILLFLVTGSAMAADQPAEKKKSKKELPGADIFDATNIIRIRITVPSSDVRRLNSRGGFDRFGGGDNRPEGKATVSDGTRTYTNVAIHLKGAAGSWRPFNGYPALTLNFEKFAPGQTFHGLRKISLNNSEQDPTFVAEKVCRELFEAAGVPVPRADYAVVNLNGRNLGLYVLVEGYNKQFLRRYFKDVSGNLYDGGFCQEISEDLSVNSGDKPNEHPGMHRLIQATVAARQSHQLEDLSKALDIDRFLSMIAIEVMSWHWDGYTMNRNNYRVYHDKDADRMVFMPHGLDQMFGRMARWPMNSSIMPPTQGAVSRVVLSTPEGRERYARRFAELNTNVFNAQRLVRRVRQLEARIAPVVAEVGRQSRAELESEIDDFCRTIENRGRQLASLSNESVKTLRFDGNGSAKLEGWQGLANFGSASVDTDMTEQGKKTLHIAANQGPSTGSWRARSSLPAGRYRFEGLVKTAEIPRGGQNGATLRLSGLSATKMLSGNTDWTELSYTFELTEPVTDVVFVCEMKGSKGEAWFDVGSLRVRKLE